MSPAVSPLLGPVCADESTSVKLRQLRSLDLIEEADMSVGRSVSAYGATISLKDTYGDHWAEAEPEQQWQVAANQTELDRKQKVAEELECVRRKSDEWGLKKTKPRVSMSPTAIGPEHIVSDGPLDFDPRFVAAATTSPAVTPRRRSVSLETIQETDNHGRRIFSK